MTWTDHSGKTVSGEDILHAKHFKFIRNLIYSNSGISLNENKIYHVKNRISDRMKNLGVITLSDYFEILSSKNPKEELRELINSITINETYFFRETKPVETLTRHILPASNGNISIWSAGCSTGEEPCSIAIHVNEYMEKTGRRINMNIIASDISFSAIQRASEGFYSTSKVRELNDDIVNKYFTKSEKGYYISEDIKKRIIYKEDNILQSKMRFYFDVIFCRNMMIYFDRNSQEEATKILYDRLRPGGYLFIGHAETLKDRSGRFKMEKIDNTITYRKLA